MGEEFSTSLSAEDATVIKTHENIDAGTIKVVYSGETYSAAYNGNGGAFALANGAVLIGEGETGTPLLFKKNYAIGHGGAIYSAAGGTISLVKAIFEGNTATNSQNTREGGAVYNSGTMTISGVTFAGNTACYGGAVRTGGDVGYLRIGDVVFDGNASEKLTYGGAIWVQGGTVEITGLLTLKQASDTLVKFSSVPSTVTVDVKAFTQNGTVDRAYFKVVDALTASQWNQGYGAFLPTVAAGQGYEVQSSTDIYLKSTDAKYDFTKAIITVGGTATELLVGGTLFTGIAYSYADSDAPAAFGAKEFIYENLPDALAISRTVKSGDTLAIKGGSFHDMTAQGIINQTGGTVILENVDFARINAGNAEGGAILNFGTMSISGATFTGNSAKYGAAIKNQGTLRIGNVVFDGNRAAYDYQGGAIWSQGTGSSVIITGLITLKTLSDTLRNFNGSTYTIDADSFGDYAYCKAIDAISLNQWRDGGNSIGVPTVTGTGYTAQVYSTDLYLKSTDKEKYDFTKAVITAGGTATELVVAGETCSGIAYSYDLLSLAETFGATSYYYENLPDALATSRTVKSGETLAIKGGTFHDMTVRGIINQTGGTVYLENVDFARINIGSTDEGGAIHNSGTMSISGATFTGNSAGYGGAIKNQGTLRIGNVVFDGNVSGNVGQGGAIWSQNTGSSVIITGLITLKTLSDTLRNFNGSTYTIDADSFGDYAYCKAIDAISLNQWRDGGNGIGVPTVTGTGYTAQVYSTDLYLKSTDTEKYDFTKAVITAGGTATELVVAGETCSGIAYSYDLLSLAGTFGATSYYYENLPDALAVSRTVKSGGTLAIKGGSFHDMTVQGIINQTGGTVILENVDFARINVGSAEGGAILNSGTMNISGATFTGNSASYGGAIKNRGTLRIGDVVFDGNVSDDLRYGGALWVQGGSIELTGLLTLKQASDTLVNYKSSTFNPAAVTIDVTAFTKNGTVDQAYFKVVDALTASQWNQTYGAFLPTVAAGQGYEVKSSTDIYLKSTDAKYDFTKAIITFGGTATELMVGGTLFTGIAYSYADSDAPAAFGAKEFIYENLPDTLAVARTVNSGETLAIKGGTFRNLSARAILNKGSVTLENVAFLNGNMNASGGAIYNGESDQTGNLSIMNGVFSSNTSTKEGGALYNRPESTLTVSGTTFTGNSAGYGGAISTYGYLRIGNVIFDGNQASGINNGGAIWLQGGTTTITGTLTLKQSSDSLANLGAMVAVDADAFKAGTDGNAYYKVIDALTASQWSISGRSFLPTVVVGQGYELKSSTDVYIKSTDTAKYNFADAVITTGGTATELVIGGTVFTGIAYSYADSDAPALFGATGFYYENLPDALAISRTVKSGETLAIKSGTFHDLSVRAINNTGNLFLENVNFRDISVANSGTAVLNGSNSIQANAVITGGLFDGITAASTGEGAAFYNYSGSTLTISGTTFTNGRAAYGGAIANYGTLRIGNVVFDGNAADTIAKGGAIFTMGDNASVTVTGTISLLTAGDTIISHQQVPVWTVETAAFGGNAWSKIFNAVSSSLWAGANYITLDDTDTYEKVTLGNDLYLHKKGAVAPTVIFSAGGEEESIVVCGKTFSGIGAKESEYPAVNNIGADNWIFDGYTRTGGGSWNVAKNSVAGDAAFALKNSSITANYYSFGNNTTVTGNVDFLMENSTVTGSVYAAGSAGISNGDLNICLTGSTITGNLSPTSGDSDSTVGKYAISLTGSRVSGAIRGTGVSSKMTVGGVDISLTDSLAGSIICLYGGDPNYSFYGNKINGPVAVTLAGSTVQNGISRKNDLYVTEFTSDVSLTVTGSKSSVVGGDITGMSVITIDAGVNLIFSGNTITAGQLVNNGIITVNGTCDAGTTYRRIMTNAGDTGTIISANGGGIWKNSDEVYYYNGLYVDSNLTGTYGEEVQITVGDKSATALYGVNAFTNSTDARTADAGAMLTILNETFANNFYGNDTTLFAGGSVAKVAYGGKLIKGDGDAGNSSLTITGGTFAALAVGGSRVSVADTSAAVTGGTAALNVSGGTIASHLIAAGYVINTGKTGTASLNMSEADLTLANITTDKYAVGGAFVNNGSATVDTVNVAVESGTYKSVFGGGWAQKGTTAVTTANLTVSGGSIHNLYAGGTDNGTGNAATVDTANITISGGSVRNIFLNGKYSRDTVTKATLNITGNCELNWIEGLSHSMMGTGAGTTLNIKSSFTVEDILHVKTWNFDFGKEVTFANGHTADLNGTAEEALQSVLNFNVGTAEPGTDGWAALTASAIEGLVRETVQINGIGATAFENNVWRFDGTAAAAYQVEYKQYDETGKALIVSKIG